MISIGGVVLSNDLIWANEFDTPVAAQSIVSTLGGNDIIQEMAISSGREIVLSNQSISGGISGYFTKAQAKQLKVIEGTIGSTTFIYEDQTIQVKILAGMVNLRPVIARPDQEDGDWYSGSVTMKEV